MQATYGIVINTSLAKSINELTDEELEAMGIKGAELVAYRASDAVKQKEILTTHGQTVATKINTAETWKNIRAKLVALGPYALLIAAVGALAAVIVIAATAESEEAKALR